MKRLSRLIQENNTDIPLADMGMTLDEYREYLKDCTRPGRKLDRRTIIDEVRSLHTDRALGIPIISLLSPMSFWSVREFNQRITERGEVR